MPPLDPRALLCENCGYHLAGLPEDSSCPECARPIHDSLPARRTGTPWQNRMGVRTLVSTVWLTLRHPIRVWSVVRVARTRTEEFGVAVIALGSLAPSVALALTLEYKLTTKGVFVLGGAAWAFQALAVFVAILIEVAGIRFFGGRHQFRINKDVARTICAQATPGWLVGGALITGLAIGFAPINQGNLTMFQIAYGCAAFLGLLTYETLVYIGMRRMRFANVVGAG